MAVAEKPATKPKTAKTAAEVVVGCIEEARHTQPRVFEMRLSAFLVCLSRETGVDLSQLYW